MPIATTTKPIRSGARFAFTGVLNSSTTASTKKIRKAVPISSSTNGPTQLWK